MNPAYPDLLYNGFLFCINFLLLLFGVLKIISRSYRNIILGVFLLTMGVGFFYNLYWPTFNHNIFYNILLGGQKQIFQAPLIFLYLVMVQGSKQNIKFVSLHLIVPLLLHVAYLTIKFGFKGFYGQNITMVYPLMIFSVFIIRVVYLFKVIVLFKDLKFSLKREVYTRYKWFALGLIGYGLLTGLVGLIQIVFSVSVPMETFVTWSRYVYSPLSIIIKLGVLLFAILESERLKEFLFGKKIYSEYELIKDDADIRAFISTHFNEKKTFKDPNFNIVESLRKENIEEKKLRLYLKKEYDKTIIDFINDYRIEEFKELVLDEANAKYSLAGIAKQVGFNSRATFYRNFKKKEGITPKEYLDGVSEKRN